MSISRIDGPVRVVGTGLLGTSIALVLRKHGVEVTLVDISPTAVKLAVEYGAGNPGSNADNPQLIVVAVPPDVVAETVSSELAAFPKAIVTDVASVKSNIFNQLLANGAELTRYVGSHPMAGRERGGAVSARADLFTGRTWVVCQQDSTDSGALRMVSDLATECGAVVVNMTASEHDSAVALVSHVPQVISSAVAASLIGAPEDSVGLAGGGLRDVTRVAASDPNLWVQILGANAAEVSPILRGIKDRIAELIDALESGVATAKVASLLTAGNEGVSRIPGKHGRSAHFTSILVVIDDRPGQLAKLLTDIGELGVNMEDLKLEHSPGSAVGFADVSVLPNEEARLVRELEARGWRIAGEAS